MTDTAVRSTGATIHSTNGEIVSTWLDALSEALAARASSAIMGLFRKDAVARDLLALSWDFRNAVGHDEIATLLTDASSTPPVSFRVREGSEPLSGEDHGQQALAAFLTFTTTSGCGNGYVNLVQEDGSWRAAAFVLSLSELNSHPERLGDDRPSGRVHGPVADRTGWREQLDPEFATQDPTVLILGAGHNGLMLAARLRVLGIPTLIVEKNDRVGDNWRKRYSSLALHTPLASDNLPYVPFPPTWTRFTPKDKFADFLECYATLLDLPVWTGSHAENVCFDEDTQRWTLDIIRADGSRRHLTPGHLVFATGMNAAPKLPDLPGRDKFQGSMIHAVEYRGHQDWAGKKAIVVGSGVSGHDLAQDLAEHGVDVTMIQRSGTVVMNTATFHTVMHANHIGGRYSTEDADLVNAATPFAALPTYYGAQQRETANAMDRELLDSLTAAGFDLSDGPDGQGALGLIYGQNATGYYYNAGASELIADGTIELVRGSVSGMTSTGIQLTSGTTLDADLVVFATGYEGPTTAVRAVLGDDVADHLGEFANVGDDREYGLLWRRCGFDRLWMMISLAIGDGRFYSKLLALQIAAIEAGTIPAQIN